MYYFVPLVVFHRPVALLSHPCRLPVAFLSPFCRTKTPCSSPVALLSLSCRSPAAFACRFPVASLSPLAPLPSCRLPVAFLSLILSLCLVSCRFPVVSLSPPCRRPVALLSPSCRTSPVAFLSPACGFLSLPCRFPAAGLSSSCRHSVVFLSPPCRLPVAPCRISPSPASRGPNLIAARHCHKKRASQQWKAPPRERPSATPTASNADPQGCTLWGRCRVAGRGTPAARPRRRAAEGGTAPDTRRPSQRWPATPPGDGPPPPPRHAGPTGHAGEGDCVGPPHPHARAHSMWLADPNSQPSGRAVRGGGAPAHRRPSQRWKALPPPPQRATPARKGARCGAAAGSHARTDRNRDTRVADPGCPPQRNGGRGRDSA